MAFRLKELTKAYRVTPEKFINDKTGKGAVMCGGRWTPPGYPVLHFSWSVSLCLVELSVPFNKKYAKVKMSQLEIEMPKGLRYEAVELKRLKKGWKSFDEYEYCRSFGLKWLEKGAACMLEVPSAMIETEVNYLFNTQHKDFKKIKFNKPQKIEINVKG